METPPTERVFPLSSEGKDVAVRSLFRPGSADLIVFLHGFGCSKDSFHDVWHHRILGEYSILCLDFIGFGNSDKPKDFSYSLESHAEVLEAVLKQVDNDPIHLVAHSMGGAVALLLPQERVDSLASFSNVEGNLLTLPSPAGERRQASVPRRPKDLSMLQRSQALALDIALRQTGSSLAQWSKGGGLLKRFQQAKCRKAYFYGDDKGELRLKSELRDCNPIQIRSAGHFVMNDNPSEFYRQLSPFMESKKE
jgi:pimeloyl-ACP methyl ester carboxylesterase